MFQSVTSGMGSAAELIASVMLHGEGHWCGVYDHMNSYLYKSFIRNQHSKASLERLRLNEEMEEGEFVSRGQAPAQYSVESRRRHSANTPKCRQRSRSETQATARHTLVPGTAFVPRRERLPIAESFAALSTALGSKSSPRHAQVS